MKIDPTSLFARSALPQMEVLQPISTAVEPSMHAAPSSVPGFLEVFERAVTSVDARGHAASERMAAVDSGQSDDLVGAMLASQEASLSFSMLMQVRNKVMGAVDEIVKLQV